MSDSNEMPIPDALRRGRGAASNRSGRFEANERARCDDGWPLDEDELRPLSTEVAVDASRTVITYNESPDLPFDRSINAYRGCEHGCIYCFARPSHAYLGLSPGLDFETKLLAKPDAAALLRSELAKPSYQCRPIALGTNTDPYQPIERHYRITRQILEVLAAHDHPVSIVTKNVGVVRDCDILAAMAAKNQARVYLSITTLDRKLARMMEPRASTPGRRLDALRQLSDAGIPCGVMVAPIIPGLTDHELEAILHAARTAGAQRAEYILVRLPREIADLFQEWLQTNQPGRARKVIHLIQSLRSGRINDAQFHSRQTGSGALADLLKQRFELACGKLHFNQPSPPLDCRRFRRPFGDARQIALL